MAEANLRFFDLGRAALCAGVPVHRGSAAGVAGDCYTRDHRGGDGGIGRVDPPETHLPPQTEEERRIVSSAKGGGPFRSATEHYSTITALPVNRSFSTFLNLTSF